MARETTRREFLRVAGAAFAAAALPADLARAQPRVTRDRDLVRRVLGRTGIELPIVSMGTSYAIDLARAALEAGIVYLHTSSGYGRHEELLGRVLRKRPRDSFVIATSPDLPYRYAPGGSNSLDVGTVHDPQRIIASMDNSLRLLGLDYVDIYYLASVGSRAPVFHEPYIEAFERLKRDGKTRFAGITTHANEPEVIRAVAESGFWDVVVTAFNFRQSHREAVRAAIHQAAGAGIGVVAMKTQAGVYWDTKRKHKINMKAALKWPLDDDCVHTAIPAFANLKELRDDLDVARAPTLTPAERRDLEADDELGFNGYCKQCGECTAQCPHGLDVPALMRGHMYAFAHGQPAKAHHALKSWTASDVPCRECSACAVKCPAGVDVRWRAIEVAGMLGSTPVG
jgi:hypothetical protein